MRTRIILLALLVVSATASPIPRYSDLCLPTVVENDHLTSYQELGLEDVVSYKAYSLALSGYEYLHGADQEELLTVIDFSRPSFKERMVVVNPANHEVLFRTVVSHGRNSGEMYATKFSNREGSYMSGLGFYRTGGTYNGGNGYSLKLEGLERGFNDNAYRRAIVIHGADYCNPSVLKSGMRLGRSLGCPALPRATARTIIDSIKGGSLLFIYAEDESYLADSPVLSQSLNPLHV